MKYIANWQNEGFDMKTCDDKTCGSAAMPPPEPVKTVAGLDQDVYLIQNMDCPTEEALIRSKLSGVAGVAELSFNLMQRRLTVTHRSAREAVEQGLNAIGMKAVRESAPETKSSQEPVETPNTRRQWL